MKNKNLIIILMMLTITFTIIGSSLAYFTWQTSEQERTVVSFPVKADFSCSADVGGTITSNDTHLMPDNCTGTHSIKRTLTASPKITGTKTIYMDLWLDVNEIGEGLTNSNNFKYALTTSSISCTTGVVSSGTFTGKKQGSKINLLSSKAYSSTITDTYYLYIWLDSAETSNTTQNQSFSLSLNGECNDDTISNAEPSEPELDDGMIPVVIDNSGSETTVKTISSGDSNWYNYKEKEWANIVLTTESSRSKYLGTTNVTISEDDILAYYVWIPRYKYKLWTTSVSSAGNEQTIDIAFEDKATPKSSGTTVGSYRTHPAFTFGDAELNGIWVGKFEVTGDATTPTVKPDLQSLRGQNISTQFATAQIFGTSIYGSTSKIDAHMMKTSEWGAVAYLSHSKYGINEEIYINNSESYYTGRSSGAVGSDDTQVSSGGTYTWDGKIMLETTIGEYASDKTLGTKASTTGNVTGAYDMSGGTDEYVMGNFKNTIKSSGFSEMPDSKYYDLYTTSYNSCTIEICGGYADFETANWYNNAKGVLLENWPWIIRSGKYKDGSKSGIFYTGGGVGSAGNTTTQHTFRSVIAYTG